MAEFTVTPAPPPVFTPRDDDGFLETLVTLSNRFGMQIPIVLQLKGLVVFGELCPAETYFEELAGQFAEGKTTSPQAEGAKAGFVTGLQNLAADLKRKREKAEGHGADYIHLRNVEIVGAGDNARAPLWRGRIASVDGFILGSRE